MLRRATREDMPRIYEIRQLVDENRIKGTFEDYVAVAGPFIDSSACWVWVEDGLILGEAGFDAKSGYVEVLYVDPAAQGRGVGRALLDRCCQALKALGHRQVTLSTTADTRAEQIYRKGGWEEVGLDDDGDILFRKAI